MARQKLGQILKEMKKVSEGDIQEALALQRREGGLIGKILIDLRVASEQDITHALARQNQMEFVQLDDLDIPIELLDFLSESQASSYRVLPIHFDAEKRALTLALDDPSNLALFDELSFALQDKVSGGVRLVGAMATKDAIDQGLAKYYGIEAPEEFGSFDKEEEQELEEEDSLGAVKGKERVAVDQDDPNAPAVIKLLNFLLATAIRDHAADIHLEPFESEFRVRYRVDGALLEMESPPLELAAPLISRIKVLSHLDIAERRMPQDGRLELTIGGRKVDLRVSTLPTMFGESCVIRILDRSNVSLDLESLGLRQRDLELIQSLISKPNGVILVTGPTGSGKTTTLYSCLNSINNPDVKIITTEDPVEYDLAGVMQCQTNPDVGLTYASALRSILRQDPDVILVGEIRDAETAQISIEAALTGHLVLSTLHTNDAPSTITRLLDIGIKDFLLSATLEAVVAQRLVRKICKNCRQWYEPDDDQLFELGLTREMAGNRKFAYGTGCEQCGGTGYKGREAIFEFMIVNETLKQMLLDGASVAQLRDKARAQGMKSLREAGVEAIFEGNTTIEEVIRETLVTKIQ